MVFTEVITQKKKKLKNNWRESVFKTQTLVGTYWNLLNTCLSHAFTCHNSNKDIWLQSLHTHTGYMYEKYDIN